MLRTFTLFVTLLLFSSCLSYPVQYWEKSVDFWGKLPAGSSIKVVHEDPSDLLIGPLESTLARRGYTVISSNTLIRSTPVADYTYRTADTTITRIERRPLVTELFDPKPAEFILRYRYSKSYFSSNIQTFSASVVRTDDGQVVATCNYNSSIGAGKPFIDFADAMLAYWYANQQ